MGKVATREAYGAASVSYTHLDILISIDMNCFASANLGGIAKQFLFCGPDRRC